MLVHHVRRDDGIAYQKAFVKLSANDIRNRFFSSLKELHMRENRAMLGLVSRLGFEIHRNPDDANTNIVTKKLAADCA